MASVTRQLIGNNFLRPREADLETTVLDLRGMWKPETSESCAGWFRIGILLNIKKWSHLFA